MLELGLKEDTADMWHYKDEYGWRCSPYTEILDEEAYLEFGTPAWSLHRLMEMVTDTPLQIGSQVGMYVEDTYDMVIQGIEWLISRGQFNKDYLEGKQ
ncbi:MAG: hypothetical protein J6U47_03735 [Bacteroidales bacterium]|nr:hypothetical protein [Bacteroidales bacterium]